MRCRFSFFQNPPAEGRAVFLMEITERDGLLSVEKIPFFSPEHTFCCGQCFRFSKAEDGFFEGVAHGQLLRLKEVRGALYLQCSRESFDSFFRRYLDLDRDYEAVLSRFPPDPVLQKALFFGRGLHILQQEPFEVLISFILSQCNTIARIRALVRQLCALFGEPFSSPDGRTFYAFPTPERLSACKLSALSPLRAGYRAPYLLSAAQAVASGALSFETLSQLDTDAARARVMALPGVGRKVADCFLLYGLNRLDAYPVDTWMQKAHRAHPEFRALLRFPFAGIAQQYIFYYTRENRRAPEGPGA